MSLLSDLETYIVHKGSSAEDAQKISFFRDIVELMRQQKLTISALTEKLAALTSLQRKSLFWLGRKKSSSPNSQAARFISDLYRILGVPLDDISLAELVAEGLSPENQKILSEYPYHYWQKNRISQVAKAKLEHELKELLKVDGVPYQGLSLVQSLTRYYGEEYPKLEEHLTKLLDNTPDYLPMMLHELYEYYFTQTDQALAFAQKIVEIVDDNPQLYQAVSNSHPQLAAALLRVYPERFFELPRQLQRQVKGFLGVDTQDAIDNLINADPLLNTLDEEGRAPLLTLLFSSAERKAAAVEGAQKHELFVHLKSTLSNQLIQDKDNLIALHQGDIANTKIKKYLSDGPNEYKSRFFRGLIADINQHGLTVTLLNKHMQGVNKNTLFANWNGKYNSRAAELMLELYKLANMARNIEEIAFIKTNLLSPREDELHLYDYEGQVEFEQRKEEYFNTQIMPNLQTKIEHVLLHPEQVNNSIINRKIGTLVHNYEAMAQFSNVALAKLQKRAEAVYQDYLIKKAFQLARAAEDGKLIFDPQGHIIISVQLTEDNYKEIYRLITGVGEGEEQDLSTLLGTSLTAKTLCNLDIAHDPELKGKFKSRVDVDNDMGELLDTYFMSSQRTSVIALQEEMMMHISLALRALEKAAKPDLLTAIQRDELMLDINTMVLQKFAAILKGVSHGNVINYVDLNKRMDEARAELAALSREKLVAAIQSSLHDVQQFADLSDQLARNLDKHAFTGSTATGLDYLRTDSDNKSAIHISATEKTAHDKRLGANELALRVIARCHYDPNNPNLEGSVVTAYENRTIEGRVPSIAIKEGSHQAAVNDVADKLAYAHGVLSRRDKAYNGPVIYNLLTSLHTKAYDRSFFEGSNRQRASAARILKGSHLYNSRQVENGETTALIYVQNIPVNQHTNELSYTAFDGATREAAVMTDMALLATLNIHAAAFSPELRQSIASTFESAHARYLRFLPQARDGDHYFKDSMEGKLTMEDLVAKKAKWQNSGPMIPAADLHSLTVQALFKMMTNNEHQRKQFGMLAQALSVYIETASLAGCKSANERAQAVAGRVGLLRSIDSEPLDSLSVEKKAVIDALTNYVSGREPLAIVQEKLDKAYNKHNLQGAIAAISMEDQGASSKVQATGNLDNPGVVNEYNTNYAETGYLDRLSQKHSAVMQAHTEKPKLADTYKQLFAEKVALQVQPVAH
ncbi:hypothetical protein [Legionella hackeliae]|uniref:Uncharacterized protein n=1 Tax=Legionella hackeliae TaxID=449 RepID=A0A0A8USM1_LEGHA|nr:hypothetical protein [Legionella hackeliae]KTD12457.1 hypothetical protein Lhac_1328 [Legionella hackeliae]CEK11870.1 protein of unknown function [Legionella hackeliae]STX48635.1 Uncharacterised protein [Legionella hackeliae]